MTRQHSIAIALIVGTLFGTIAGTAVTALTPEAPAPQVQTWPERELPLEWRKPRPDVTFDHMFMPSDRGRR